MVASSANTSLPRPCAEIGAAALALATNAAMSADVDATWDESRVAGAGLSCDAAVGDFVGSAIMMSCLR
jgi:hypothetical protein